MITRSRAAVLTAAAAAQAVAVRAASLVPWFRWFRTISPVDRAAAY